MKKYNIIAVFDKEKEKTLMCLRTKNPYIGLYNLVGGKIENDNYFAEAYRELKEETDINKEDIKLIHLMNLTYIDKDYELQVYYGVLNKYVEVKDEVNKLVWISLKENFYDMNKFAGEGNIYHIFENIKLRNYGIKE